MKFGGGYLRLPRVVGGGTGSQFTGSPYRVFEPLNVIHVARTQDGAHLVD